MLTTHGSNYSATMACYSNCKRDPSVSSLPNSCSLSALDGPVLSKVDCDAMERNYPTCSSKSNFYRMSFRRLMMFSVEKCHRTGRNQDCVDADSYCTQNIEGIYEKSHRSYYDIRARSAIRNSTGTYIPYLNQTETRALIGARRTTKSVL